VETGELMNDRGRKAGRLRKLPTPVLSGSGSRVFLSPTSVEHPCLNNMIETFSAVFCKKSRYSGPAGMPMIRQSQAVGWQLQKKLKNISRILEKNDIF
jgi:hypothetical protein